MKSCKDVIISFIKDLHYKYNDLIIRYEYNELREKHIVEILSKADDLCNDSIWELKYDFSRKIKQEFGEALLFISESSLSKISEPIFEIGNNPFTVNNNVVDFKFDFNSWVSLNDYALAA